MKKRKNMNIIIILLDSLAVSFISKENLISPNEKI